MRLLKVAIAAGITVVAMFFSLLVALGVAVIGVIAFLFLRLRGRSANVRFRTSMSSKRPASPPGGDVIDVTATEVPSHRLDR